MGQSRDGSNDNDDDNDDEDDSKDDDNVVYGDNLTCGGGRYTGRSASVVTTGPGRWQEGKASGTWRSSGNGHGAAGAWRRCRWPSSRWFHPPAVADCRCTSNLAPFCYRVRGEACAVPNLVRFSAKSPLIFNPYTARGTIPHLEYFAPVLPSSRHIGHSVPLQTGFRADVVHVVHEEGSRAWRIPEKMHVA